MKVMVCPNCGKEFEVPDRHPANKRYCSQECKQAYKKKMDKVYRDTCRHKKKPVYVKEDNKKAIYAIVEMAEAEGMTYGQYVGQQILREAKDESEDKIHK